MDRQCKLLRRPSIQVVHFCILQWCTAALLHDAVGLRRVNMQAVGCQQCQLWRLAALHGGAGGSDGGKMKARYFSVSV